MKRFIATLVAITGLAFANLQANAADFLDPTPIAQQETQEQDSAPAGKEPAVDGINFKLSLLSGVFQRNVLGDATNHMFVGSVSAPIPYLESFGVQLDVGTGIYDDSFTSAAAGLHIFWRDPNVGLFGIYGDWGYVNPEHAGRTGFEAALYLDRYSIDVFVGKQYGQHVYTEVVDEVDLSYYFTDNLRGSVGHRLTSRGHVANVAFEYMPENYGALNGLSYFGELEGGEDNYYAAWGGIRYSFGTGNWKTLIDRDRRGDPPVRIPRNMASVTQCGDRDVTLSKTWWRAPMSNLCASEDEINAVSTPGIVKK